MEQETEIAFTVEVDNLNSSMNTSSTCTVAGVKSLFYFYLSVASQHTKLCYLFGSFIAFLGFGFNYFCYRTALNLPFQSTSTLLMSYLAIWDSISAFHDGIIEMALKIFNINLSNINLPVCKLYYYHSWASTFNASFHLVALALDRALSILLPIWHHNLDHIKAARFVSWSSTITCYIITLPNFYFFSVVDHVCTMEPRGFPNLLSIYVKVLTYVIFSGGPFLLLLLSNSVFIHKICMIRQKKENEMQSRCTERSSCVPSRQKSSPKTTEMKQGVIKLVDQLQIPNQEKGTNGEDNLDGLCYEVYCGPSAETTGFLSDAPPTAENKTVTVDANWEPRSTSTTGMSSDATVYRQYRSSRKSLSRQDRSVVVMLIVLSCSYLVLSASAAFLHEVGHQPKSEQVTAQSKLFALAVTETLAVMNNSLNFVFYYMSGSTFRQVFKQTFLAGQRCC